MSTQDANKTFADPAATARWVKEAAGFGTVEIEGAFSIGLRSHLNDWAANIIEQGDGGTRDAWVHVGSIGSASELESLAQRGVASCARRLVVALYFECADIRQDEADSVAWLGVRAALERAFILAGARKHPSTYLLCDYETMGGESGEVRAIFEPLPIAALKKYPLHVLEEERDLHMDMLREAGERSDAHVARYEWASRYVRPGDRVLDAACGLGYGTYVMSKRSEAHGVLGIDGSDWARDYADVSFSDERVKFRTGFLPDVLMDYPDASFDLIVSFETLEHVDDPVALLREYARLLTPGGRIVVSVPNDWSDESGKDPNPHHLHVYEWERLRHEMSGFFIVEEAWQQIASGCKQGSDRVWRPASRRLQRVTDQSGGALDAEWWLAVGMKDPLLNGESLPYRDAIHLGYSGSRHLVDFAEHYRNPWLVHALVEIPYRLHDKALLGDLAGRVRASFPVESPEFGASLAVAGYALLERRIPDSAAMATWRGDYLDFLRKGDAAANPHVARWKISLTFLSGRLHLAEGALHLAAEDFQLVSVAEVVHITPTLGTKVVEAAFRHGVIAFSLGELATARASWKHGIRRAHDCLSQDWTEFYGDLDTPLEFSMNDAVEVMDLAARCAAALRATSGASGISQQDALAMVERKSLRSALTLITYDLVSALSDKKVQAEKLREAVTTCDELRRSLAVAEDHSFVRMSELQELDAALGEAQRLSLERLSMIERLVPALESSKAVAFDRGVRIDELNAVIADLETLAQDRLRLWESTDLALAEARKHSSIRADELNAIIAGLEALGQERLRLWQATDSALAEAQQYSVEHVEQVRSLGEELEDERGRSLARLQQIQKLDASRHDLIAHIEKLYVLLASAGIEAPIHDVPASLDTNANE
ncbi:MAG: methyltransferase domain-containing protein [Pseudoxanthomonas sp.]